MGQSIEVEGQLAQLFSLIQGAETGQRGYLLTGDDSYLAPYSAAGPDLDREFKAVGDALADDPIQEQRLTTLRRLARGKQEELAATIAMYRAGNAEAALARIRTGEGRKAMDGIRETIALMLDEERSRQSVLRASVSQAASKLQIGVIAVAIVFLALAVFAVINAYKQMRGLVASRDALRTANENLVGEAIRREALETQLRQSQKMEAIGQLTGGVAHDFNNMLAVIMGSLELIKRRVMRGELNVERYVDSAMDGATRAAALTHRLLAFARQQALAPQSIEVNKLVGGMSDLLRRTLGEDIQLEVVLAGGGWRTYADFSELESAILNLAVNARDAMPDGGRLTIETANCHLDDSYSSAHIDVPAGQYVLVAVTDTGCGMPADVAAKVFDPFFTTKAAGKGTGLGLSQVYGFVKQSGGHIKIYSEPGEGTTVKLYLPRFTGAAAPVAKKTPDQAIPTGNASEAILVVDDEERARHITAESLRELGYSVLEADGAASALRILEGQPATALLFTDIVMPEVNGRKLADEAVRRLPGLKVLYTTGYTRNAVVHSGAVDPDVQLISKPFSHEQLARKVRELLDAK